MSKEAKEQQDKDEQLKELSCALEEEKKRSEEYLTRLKYVQADFENLKKRVDRQIEDVAKYCTERLVLELLDIADELEMAVKSSCSSNSNDSLIQGVKMTLKKLRKVLESEGVSQIECIGKPFDPTKHTAVAKIERDDVDEFTVVEEVRKGYIMRGKVIRPSIVKIAVKPQSESQKEMNSNE